MEKRSPGQPLPQEPLPLIVRLSREKRLAKEVFISGDVVSACKIMQDVIRMEHELLVEKEQKFKAILESMFV